MSCIMRGCMAIALQLPQSMDHSFAATCSLCNGMPPASKSAAQMCRLRTWRSRYTIRRRVRKGPRGVSRRRRSYLNFANRASTRISGIFFQKSGFWPLGCVGSARLPLLPDVVGHRVVEAEFPPHRISGRKFQKIGLTSFTRAKRQGQVAATPTSDQ
jgi:hypothetical protein